MKIANTNPKQEVLAYLMFMGVYWGFMYSVYGIESFLELYDQAWITSLTRVSLDYLALVLAIMAANRIGSISYIGLSLISLFGVIGFHQVLFFRTLSSLAESVSFSPWYTLVPFIALVNFILFLVRYITNRSSALRRFAPPPDA